MNYNDIINSIASEQIRVRDCLIDAKSIVNIEEYKFQLGQYHGLNKALIILKKAVSRDNGD